MKNTHKFLNVYVVLIVLALASFIGLDYISWKKEEKSIVFPVFPQKHKIPGKQKNLIHIVDHVFVSTQIPEKDTNKYTDKQGGCHIMVILDRDKYRLLEKNLEESFFNINATIQKKREPKKKDKKRLLWEVKKKGEIPLFLLFSIEQEKERKKTEQLYEPKNKAALIIDDMGYSMDNIIDLCSMKKDLTIAVLPYSPYAEETAKLAHHNGLEVILHLPLESMNNIYDNEHTLGLINSGMDQKEISEILKTNLRLVPFISGVNTHMGSKVTQDNILMEIILENIKGSHLYFIDSRTTPHSVAYDTAQKFKIPSAYRHIFLDNKTEPEYIKNQLIKLFKTAEKNGKALGICHPFPETMQVLKKNIHQAEKHNVELVFASQIVH
ncbi:MAG: divergent polysaccharide deacetylase family protein [Acidobacteriota bacterium]